MINLSPLAAAIISVTITGGTATALMLGGVHSAAPPSAGTPTVAQEVPGMVAQTFTWPKQDDATGYRIYLDGAIAGLVPYTTSVLAVTCGVPHRFNAQPFNNKGVAKLSPPAYFTPSCDRATRP